MKEIKTDYSTLRSSLPKIRNIYFSDSNVKKEKEVVKKPKIHVVEHKEEVKKEETPENKYDRIKNNLSAIEEKLKNLN